MPYYTTGLSILRVEGCALTQTTVNSLFSSLNAFFSVNTPIKNLTVYANAGTNASPTGGHSNTDIVALVAKFTASGFTFTYLIN